GEVFPVCLKGVAEDQRLYIARNVSCSGRGRRAGLICGSCSNCTKEGWQNLAAPRRDLNEIGLGGIGGGHTQSAEKLDARDLRATCSNIRKAWIVAQKISRSIVGPRDRISLSI